MLTRFDPFRELERAMTARPLTRTVAPMDAVRTDDHLELHFDLPGFDADSIDLTVERNVLTLTARRTWQPAEGEQAVVRERRHGVVRRQVVLSDALDGDRVEASYDAGVLTVRIPVAETAQPRRVAITVAGGTDEGDGEADPSTN